MMRTLSETEPAQPADNHTAENSTRQSTENSTDPARRSTENATEPFLEEPADDDPNAYWGVGLLSELIGTVFNVIGKQCFRLAKLRDNKCWYVGGLVFIFILYPVFNLLAVNLAPNSVVSAMDGMVVVWNILLAPFTLGEHVTVSRLTSALLITIGTILSALLGNHSDYAEHGDEYLHLFAAGTAIVYYCVFFLIVGTCLYLIQYKFPMETRIGGAITACLGGWIGGNSGVWEKGFIAFASDKEWGRFELWLLVLLYLVLCASALTLFAFATRHHEALYALPLYEAWIILGGSISGYSLVHEGAGQPIGNIVGYWLSLCLLLVGLYVLVWWPPIFAQHIGDGEEEIQQFNDAVDWVSARCPWLFRSCQARDKPSPTESSSLVDKKAGGAGSPAPSYHTDDPADEVPPYSSIKESEVAYNRWY